MPRSLPAPYGGAENESLSISEARVPPRSVVIYRYATPHQPALLLSRLSSFRWNAPPGTFQVSREHLYDGVYIRYHAPSLSIIRST